VSRKTRSNDDMTPQLCVPGATAVVRHVARTSRRRDSGGFVQDGYLQPGDVVVVNDVFSLPGRGGRLAAAVIAADGSGHVVLAKKLRFECNGAMSCSMLDSLSLSDSD
jgi:hypothetical protein